MLESAMAGEDTILIPPRAGKTLAGFLTQLGGPGPRRRPHPRPPYLYVSPLKPLTTDIARNLEATIEEMAFP